MKAVTALGRDDDVLSLTESSRVVRRHLPGGSVILKESLGLGAASRAAHEKAMLERLAALPGISKLRDTASGDRLTLSLEDEGGLPLAAILQRERLGMATVLELALGLAETVGAMHRLGVAHRDLNPANILLVGAQRRPVIIDFHIASSFAEERPAFTAQSEIAGTLAYIAPEQTGRTGHILDRRADLYSLGATLYELATGKTPFEGNDAFALIRDHLVRIPVPPAERDERVPQGFSDIVMRLLEKEPDRRYQSAEGLAHDIRTLIERRALGESDSHFLLAQHDFPQRLLPPSRLIGREREIEALRTAFDDAVTGRGNALIVSGAPGVGKTSLIDELRSIVTANGGWFVTGKFDQYRRDLESDAARKALRSLIGMLLTEPEDVLVPLRARLLGTMGANAALAAALLPELAVLLDIAPDLTLSDPFSAPGRLAKAGTDILRCIASSARPIVFVIDDLQWASATPLGFLDAAISDTTTRGLLIVGSYRATEVDVAHPLATLLSRWDRASVKPRKLFLDDLKPAELGNLLEEMLRLSPGRAVSLAAAVGARTGGNPYDTVELINALRREGVLAAGNDGWTWDEATIRRYVGQGDVVDLLSARIDALPAECAALLETVACLGGNVSLELLQAAGAFSPQTLQKRLAPALEDGLVSLEHRAGIEVRFRHDRVQQAAYLRIETQARIRLRLTLARRLDAAGKFATVAAEQYLHAVGALRDPAETLRVIGLFREAGLRAGLTASYAVAEGFFATAVTLLASLPHPDDTLMATLQSELHATLYALGRLEEADVVYESLERRGDDVLSTDSACVQISSLTNRNRPREAVAIGLRLLRKAGLAPPERSDLDASNEARLDEIYRWCDDEAARTADLRRSDRFEPRLLGAAKLINRMIPAAYFCDQPILGWLVLESFRLWDKNGPCAVLVGPMSHAGLIASAIRDDYRIGYRAALRIIAICEAQGYEAETSHARFVFAVGTAHWFDALERCVTQARFAREELLRSGDLQNACLTFYASIPLLLECSQTLEELSIEVEAGLAFCIRTGNDQAANSYVVHRQLTRALRGETEGVGQFADASFDEHAHVAGLGVDATATIYYHVTRALSALLFADAPTLIHHAGVAHSLLRHIPGIPPTALTVILQAVALAWRVRDASSSERSALLAELDLCHQWLQKRALDAPDNFLHSVRLVEAERAWSQGDFARASAAFEAALEAVRTHSSPRHRAFIAERAGIFYLEHRLRRYGELLLRDARELYETWGATAKARQLERKYPFLLASDLSEAQRAAPTTLVSSESIDLIGIVRASQALSSETTLAALKARVVELLGALTGATAVLLILRIDDSDDWFLTSDADTGPALSVQQAGALGRLPLTAFRYVERTHEPLLVADALRDDRFSRDRYFADFDRCSMLVVPILRQGEPRAMLLLENRLSRDAFNPARLDSVMLIAGQLAVSLDNALLYASLERKVTQRTEALAEANRKLEQLSLTDALTGLVNRRGFDEKLAAEWSRAKRSGTPLGLAMIDVDEFKSFNDYYGHPAGDVCLRRVGQTLGDGIRPGADLAARYGGEEFALILPGSDLAGMHAAAERLRAAVAALAVPSAAAKHGIVTISIGIAAFVPRDDTSAQHYLEAADAALYRAKRLGRNRVAEAGAEAAV